MGWVGGLIAWLVNKDVDPKRARAMLFTGIAISAVVIILLVSAPPSTPDPLNRDVAPPSAPPITPQASATRVPVTGSGPIHR